MYGASVEKNKKKKNKLNAMKKNGSERRKKVVKTMKINYSDN